MLSFPGIILSVSLLLLSQASGLFAKSLDIFDTSNPFPLILPALDERTFDLGRLNPQDMPVILNHYETALKRAGSREEKNLLGLALGHLYFQNGNPQKAAHYLKEKIVGNFVLEDFRLDRLALALKKQGQQELLKQKYPQAIEYFKQSEQRRINIFRNYPDSPFHANVSGDLAEIDYLLGEAYFLAVNYKAAWQAFRRSLMRDFPENKEHRFKVNLALAKIYQSAGDLENAADIYITLLKSTSSHEAREMAIKFFKIYERKLNGLGIELDDVRVARPPARAKKQHAPPKKPKVIYKNERVREFHESLNQDDPLNSLELGLKVMEKYPGIQEARGVIKLIKLLVPLYLESDSNNGVVEKISTLFPPKDLNKLALLLWRAGQTKQATFFYEKIIQQYPLEINACHKALFFLGRIAEDEREYSKAVAYYELLLKKYDFGPYTTFALFKIPWIERLQKKYNLALTHFERLLKFNSSTAYRQLKKSYPNSTFQPESMYWLAQTHLAAGNINERDHWLKRLAEKHPFDFYSILTQGESGFDLKKFLTRKDSQDSAFRKFGLGEIDRKRLSRAEKLIATGFRSQGAKELAGFPFHRDNPAFSFYIANLLKRGGDYQNGIIFSWRLTGNGNRKKISRPISEGMFPKGYIREVLNTLKHYQLDPFLILSLIRQESAFNSKIESKANAVGLMQLIPPTAEEVARKLEKKTPTVESLKDPVTNVQLGIEYLNSLMVSFNQNMVYALAAYNAGPTKVRQWVALNSDKGPIEFIESIPYTETRKYVKKILRNYAIYLTLYDEKNLVRFKNILMVNSN